MLQRSVWRHVVAGLTLWIRSLSPHSLSRSPGEALFGRERQHPADQGDIDTVVDLELEFLRP
jgi:hypothetical protein